MASKAASSEQQVEVTSKRVVVECPIEIFKATENHPRQDIFLGRLIQEAWDDREDATPVPLTSNPAEIDVTTWQDICRQVMENLPKSQQRELSMSDFPQRVKRLAGLGPEIQVVEIPLSNEVIPWYDYLIERLTITGKVDSARAVMARKLTELETEYEVN